MTMEKKELKQIREHFIYIDYYEYVLGRYFSSWLIYLIKDSRVTPNQLTLASIFLNICAAISFAQGKYAFFLAGATLLQFAFIFDFADGQLARYRNMTSGFGKWMDIMGDVLSDCLLYAGLAYGVYTKNNDYELVILVLLTCTLMPYYCLHRQVRDGVNKGCDQLSKNTGGPAKGALRAIKRFPLHKKLIFSIGVILNLPQVTLMIVSTIVLVKFIGSVLIFIFQSERVKRTTSACRQPVENLRNRTP